MPLAVWASSLRSLQDVKRAVVAEVELTHPDMLVQAAAFLYAASIKYLLNHPDEQNRAQRAFDQAMKLCDDPLGGFCDAGGFSCKRALEEAKRLADKASDSAGEEFFLDNSYDCRERPTFVQHAFVLSYFFLLRAKAERNLDNLFRRAMLHTVKLGGDTKTNTCIVGGMIGSLVGVKGLPAKMYQRVLQFDSTAGGVPRDEFLNVRLHAVQMIDAVITARPVKRLVTIEKKE